MGTSSKSDVVAAPPTGDVTFCFTDIEGSTRLAQRLGPEWRPTLERHYALLRDAWQKNGGYEVKTEGDAFFVTFADTAAAVSASLEAQRSIRSEAWPAGADIRVRMGLHRGKADLVDGDYIGVEVHKAARVAAAAHGGQVLLSGAAAAAVDPPLAENASLCDLGRFTLKDFDEPETLWRLEDGEDALPVRTAPRAVPAAAHNLPLLRTSFVGREVETTELGKLIDEERLVTVLGPGGLGKTRLALEVARASVADFPDGVWAVLLAGEDPGSDITPVVARVLGVADAPGVPLLEAIAASVSDRRLLVLLDNCEHVIASVAEVADALLSAGSGVSVLATSRQPLGTRGERVWSLPFLSLPAIEEASQQVLLESEAIQLFAERAAAANPRFRFNDETSRAAARLCLQLDGLPLALELAAVATRTMPMAKLAERIGDSLALLRTGNRTDAARQQSLENLIGWSYDLLDDAQQALFRRLSVFRGGWTLEAAEEVCAGAPLSDGEVVGHLADLVDRSLVNIDTDDRYRMLVLVRAYAESRLDAAGERAATEAAHVGYFRVAGDAPLATARDFLTVEAEIDNCRHAFATALSRGDAEAAYALAISSFGNVLLHKGHYGEVIEILERTLSLISESSVEAVRLRANIAQLSRLLGDAERAAVELDVAAGIASSIGDADLVAVVAVQRAYLYQDTDADRVLELALPVLDLPVSALRKGMAQELLGFAHARKGDIQRAIEASLETARLYDDAGEPLRSATARMNAAELIWADGDSALAYATIEESLQVADSAGLPRLRAHGLYVRSRMDLREDRLDRLVTSLEEALDVARRIGEARMEAGYAMELALARATLGDVEGAAADLMTALPQLRQHGMSDQYPDALATAGRVAATRGLASEAGALAASCHELTSEGGVARKLIADIAVGEALEMDEALDLAMRVLEG